MYEPPKFCLSIHCICQSRYPSALARCDQWSYNHWCDLCTYRREQLFSHGLAETFTDTPKGTPRKRMFVTPLLERPSSIRLSAVYLYLVWLFKVSHLLMPTWILREYQISTYPQFYIWKQIRHISNEITWLGLPSAATIECRTAPDFGPGFWLYSTFAPRSVCVIPKKIDLYI